MNPTISKPTRDKAGRSGVHVAMEFVAQGWHTHLTFATHGMTAAEAVAQRDRLEAHHQRKAAKLTELSALIGTHLQGGFVITDATVRDAGISSQLLVRAVDRSGRRMEFAKHYGDPSSIPLTAALDGITSAVNETMQSDATATAHAAEVRQALGL